MILGPYGKLEIDTSRLTTKERDIYQQKQASQTTYHYDSPEALYFELRLRLAITEAAVALDKSAAEFASFKRSRCNPAFWDRTDKGGFQLRSGVLPSNAIQDIFSNSSLYAFECATAIIIILYKALLDTIGAEAFNRMFKDLYLLSWNHDNDLHLTTMYEHDEAYPGDVQYFKNPEVNPRTMEWQGENVVRLSGNRFFGHGIGIGGSDKIIGKLNKHRIPGSTVSAYLMNEVTYPNFIYLYQASSGGELPLERIPAGPVMATQQTVVGRIGTRTSIHRLPQSV
ncbi:protein-glutamine gamma-glutamyltransferase [Paenibacillus cremeus]|uniref:Protein-glutamine gamma-glutamyltransferase n=1 Tax=Paenibacillus cremeus TaxID=2163881 RepID=A0A559KDN7_9BACL|nr:protein-glutamine gamma-glutamyltransferase [Paenibacillus cremeus]TVY10256.1 protein-glutamine gamma-glutamyltransferase [Paenibacillus cremeus]